MVNCGGLIREIQISMKIKTLKFSLILLTLTALFISCNNDDDGGSTFVVADRTEQQVIDKDSI